MNTKYRSLHHRIPAKATADGDGVKINRVAGKHVNKILDPFLLLDEMGSDDSADYIGGFPAHPHRGFETVTYMITGAMRHKDHMGNEGLLTNGDVQWMTAGRGVIHSEMPEQEDGLLHGFQLWVNLPAKDKLKSASYQEYKNDDFPVIALSNGGRIKLVAGSIDIEGQQQQGPVQGVATAPMYLDVELAAGEEVELPVPETHTVLVYVYEGSSTELDKQEMGAYQNGNRVKVKAGNGGMRFLLLAGQPLNEPIAQYGPFVMNTRQEIEQAINDYQNGVLTSGSVEA
jgi:redox-sensitive bicupin YhaK (pirin superfamily)